MPPAPQGSASPTAERAMGILRRNNLRRTPARVDVLDRFLNHDHAQSHADLELALPAYDRVTLYRTLQTFEQSGILHRVPGEPERALFGLSDFERLGEMHVHFRCDQCTRTYCLPSLEPLNLAVPRGFRLQTAEVLATGQCASCRTAH